MDTIATDSFRNDSTTTSQACHDSATAGNAVRGRLNAAVLRTSGAYGHLMMGRRKRRLFAGLPPAVAEIGPGTGANLRYYRPGTQLSQEETPALATLIRTFQIGVLIERLAGVDTGHAELVAAIGGRLCSTSEGVRDARSSA